MIIFAPPQMPTFLSPALARARSGLEAPPVHAVAAMELDA